VSPLFTGVTLTPDLYFLIVSIDSGFAIWSASSVATAAVFEAPGIENLLDFLAADTRPWVPFSDFRADFDHGRLHYSIDQVDAVVPEPATALLVLIGIAARGRRRA
jgi:hypothetical protein